MAHFKPSLRSSITLVIAIIIFLVLAYWQYQRIGEKKQLEQNYIERTEAQPLVIDQASLDKHSPDFFKNKLWQPITLNGSFLKDTQFLLDNQVYQGKPGYHVIAPFKLEGSETLFLVNRGWLPAGTNRQQLPAIPAIPAVHSSQNPHQNDIQSIIGQLASAKKPIAGFDTANTESLVQLFISFDALSQKFSAPIFPMLILLDENADDPLPRQWPSYQAKIEMHEFYFIHWLIAALVAVLLYIYFGYQSGRQD